MKSLYLLLFVLGSMRVSVAYAQQPVVRQVHAPAGASTADSATPGAALTLEAVCDGASVSDTGVGWGVGTTVTCRVELRSGLALVRIRYDGAEEGWLARPEGGLFHIIALVDTCLGDEEADCGFLLHRVRRRTLGTHHVVEVETESVYHSEDLGDPAVGVERHTTSLAVCLVVDDAIGFACADTFHIRVRELHLSYTARGAREGVEWTGHVVSERSSRVDVQLRTDGRLVARLREGTWHQLYARSLDPEEPDADARSVELRWLALLDPG